MREKQNNGYKGKTMRRYKNITIASALLMLVCLLILTGCGTVRQGTACPQIPELPVKVPLGENFRDPMQAFLQGKLPEPIQSGMPSQPVTDSPTQ